MNFYIELIPLVEETSSATKYGRSAGQKVRKTMAEFKRKELHAGRPKKSVRNRKQINAVELPQARQQRAYVPKKRK